MVMNREEFEEVMKATRKDGKPVFNKKQKKALKEAFEDYRSRGLLPLLMQTDEAGRPAYNSYQMDALCFISHKYVPLNIFLKIAELDEKNKPLFNNGQMLCLFRAYNCHRDLKEFEFLLNPKIPLPLMNEACELLVSHSLNETKELLATEGVCTKVCDSTIGTSSTTHLYYKNGFVEESTKYYYEDAEER